MPPRETAGLARRDMLRLGLMGASVLALGTGGSVLAGEEGIERKVIKEVDSKTGCMMRRLHAPKHGMTPGQPTRKMSQHQARTLVTTSDDDPGCCDAL